MESRDLVARLEHSLPEIRARAWRTVVTKFESSING